MKKIIVILIAIIAADITIKDGGVNATGVHEATGIVVNAEGSYLK